MSKIFDIKRSPMMLFVPLLVGIVMLIFIAANIIQYYWWLILFIVFVLILLYMEIRTENELDVFSPVSIFILCTFIFYIMPACLDPDIGDPLFIKAVSFALISVPMFTLGYFYAKRFKSFVPKLRDYMDKWSIRDLLLIGLIFLPISATIFMFVIRSYGGFYLYMTNIWQASRETLTTGKMYLVEVMTIPIIASYFIYADYYVTKRKALLYIGVLFIAIFGVAGSLLSGGRSNIIVPIFSVFVIRHYLYKRFGIKDMVVAVTVILLLLFVLGTARDYVQFGHIAEGNISDFIASKDVVNYLIYNLGGIIYDVYKNIIGSVPYILDYQHGFTYYVFAVKLIPGGLIPDKVYGASQVVMENLYPSVKDVYFAPSYLGELYLNFGMLGIIFGTFIFGVLSSMFYLFLKGNSSRKLAVIIYTLLLPTFIGEMRGDFGTVTGAALIICLKFAGVYALLHVLNRFKLRRSSI